MYGFPWVMRYCWPLGWSDGARSCGRAFPSPVGFGRTGRSKPGAGAVFDLRVYPRSPGPSSVRRHPRKVSAAPGGKFGRKKEEAIAALGRRGGNLTGQNCYPCCLRIVVALMMSEGMGKVRCRDRCEEIANPVFRVRIHAV